MTSIISVNFNNVYTNSRVVLTSTDQRLSCNRRTIMVIEDPRGVSLALTDILEITIFQGKIRSPIHDHIAILTSKITITTTLIFTVGPWRKIRRKTLTRMKKFKLHLHEAFNGNLFSPDRSSDGSSRISSYKFLIRSICLNEELDWKSWTTYERKLLRNAVGVIQGVFKVFLKLLKLPRYLSNFHRKNIWIREISSVTRYSYMRSFKYYS